MTRVLFVQGSADVAGAERVLLTLLRNLDRTRVDPVVAFLARGPFVDNVRSAGVETVLLPPAGRLRHLGRLPQAVRAIARAVDASGADVVQGTGEKMSVLAGWAARRTGRPAVFWLHDAPGAGGVAGRLTQRAISLVPHASVVTCSEWLARDFASKLGLRATAIHNGIDAEALPHPGAARAPVASEAGWPDDAVVVGHFARLQRWKGTDVFLRAAAAVARERPEVRFLVVGGALYGREERYAGSLPALAEGLGLGGRVYFTGYRTDALELMGSVDVVAHCSLDPDPFPTVVLEAMALGRALVATRTRGPEEAIDHGRTGLLVPPGDAEALARAIDGLVHCADERRSLGEYARIVVAERFTARRMAERFEELYRSLTPEVVRT